jgi:hypothetical protein
MSKGIQLRIENPSPGAIIESELAVNVSLFVENEEIRKFISVSGLELNICFTVDRDHYTRDCSGILFKNTIKHLTESLKRYSLFFNY